MNNCISILVITASPGPWKMARGHDPIKFWECCGLNEIGKGSPLIFFTCLQMTVTPLRSVYFYSWCTNITFRKRIWAINECSKINKIYWSCCIHIWLKVLEARTCPFFFYLCDRLASIRGKLNRFFSTLGFSYNTTIICEQALFCVFLTYD